MAKWKVCVGAALLIAASGQLRADDYSAGWGPAVGSSMPMLAAPDHAGAQRSLADLSGEQGLLLFLSRSADW